MLGKPSLDLFHDDIIRGKSDVTQSLIGSAKLTCQSNFLWHQTFRNWRHCETGLSGNDSGCFMNLATVTYTIINRRYGGRRSPMGYTYDFQQSLQNFQIWRKCNMWRGLTSLPIIWLFSLLSCYLPEKNQTMVFKKRFQRFYSYHRLSITRTS